MTWEWSYSAEGLEEIYESLCQKSRDFLVECFAEIRASHVGENEEENFFADEFSTIEFFKYSELARTLSNDTLVDAIWEYAQNLAECSNGDHEVYLCPYHCHSIFLR